MRVPTTDYSPLRQANSAKVQAQRTQFIAPNIDYQTRSLERRKQGLDSTMSHLKNQEMLGTLKFINSSLTNLIAGGLGAMEAKQGQQAQAMVSQMADDLKTYTAQGFANGDFYYEYTDVDTDPTHNTGGKASLTLHGADKIQAFQDQQMKTLQSQGWLRNIEDGAMSSMQGVYSGMQSSMAQDFFAKQASDKAKLEQLNLQNAIDSDMAETNFTDYRRTDRFLSSLKGYTPQAIEMMRRSAHEQVDIGRASDIVRTTAMNQGTQPAVDYANSVSDQRNYGVDTRNRLVGLAHTYGNQAKAAAMNSGMQFMDTEIQNALTSGTTPDFKSLWDQKKEENSRLPKEQRDAYESGMEKSQLGYLLDYKNNAMKDIDFKGIDQIEEEFERTNSPEFNNMFEGTASTIAVRDAIRKEYSDRINAYRKAEADYYKALGADYEKADKAARAESKDMLTLMQGEAENVHQDFKDRKISGAEAVEKLYSYRKSAEEAMADRPVDFKDIYNFQKTVNKLIHDVSTEYIEKNVYKDEINQAMKRADDFFFQFYGVDTDETQRMAYDDAMNTAKGSLLDLAYDGKNLNQADFDRRITDIIAVYQLKMLSTYDPNKIKGSKDAVKILSSFEDNPNAVYEKNDKGDREWVWVNEDARKNFANAAKLGQQMIDEEYGIDIDYDKPIEYGSIRGQLEDNGAENKGLVPVYTAKDGKRYTIQGGKVYQYFNHRTASEIKRK